MPARRSAGAAAPAASPARTSARAPVTAPVLVQVTRGDVVESRHRGHVVQVGRDGTVECAIGDPGVVVSLRSAAKPFGLVAFVESGAADALDLTRAELAVLAASHSGEDLHVRTIQAVLRRAGVSQQLLACGSDGAPLDEVTALRLARDGERPSPIRHMCSGQHASHLLLSKHAGWPLDGYWHPDHPAQVAFRDALARVLGIPPSELVTATDACGTPTYAVPLVEVARAFALLADPAGVAPDAARRGLAPALLRIRDAMLAAPDVVGGTRGRLDTALMRTLKGRVVAKSGAEALRGVALLPGSRGPNRPAAGLAVKIEDGDGSGRAGPAATIEALRQVGVATTEDLRELAPYHRPPLHDPQGERVGACIPAFDLVPLAEMR